MRQFEKSKSKRQKAIILTFSQFLFCTAAFAGYEWVGWRNDTFAVDLPLGVATSTTSAASAPSVEMVWKFDAIRNFTSLRIHCNNMFTKDVRVFRAARISFSVGGSVFSSPPMDYRSGIFHRYRLLLERAAALRKNSIYTFSIFIDGFRYCAPEVERFTRSCSEEVECSVFESVFISYCYQTVIGSVGTER